MKIPWYFKIENYNFLKIIFKHSDDVTSLTVYFIGIQWKIRSAKTVNFLGN